jgi:hypothetical protein
LDGRCATGPTYCCHVRATGEAAETYYAAKCAIQPAQYVSACLGLRPSSHLHSAAGKGIEALRLSLRQQRVAPRLDCKAPSKSDANGTACASSSYLRSPCHLLAISLPSTLSTVVCSKYKMRALPNSNQASRVVTSLLPRKRTSTRNQTHHPRIRNCLGFA